MASLTENIAQAISDFDSIKTAIEDKGVEVADGTATSRYGDLIKSIPAGDDTFWDSYQQSGTLKDYNSAFAGKGWNDNTFNPKYIISPASATRMFYRTGIKDLSMFADKLDYSGVTSIDYIFAEASTEHIGVFDVRNVASVSSAFYYMQSLKTIDKLIIKDDGSTQFVNNSFGVNTSLEDITIEGVIGQGGLNLQWSKKLSSKSIENIISVLSDNTQGLAITLPDEAKTAYYTAHESEYADEDTAWNTLIATKPNWTISLL